MLKTQKKLTAKPVAAREESDSESAAESSDAGEEFMSDEEFPMSEDDSDAENDESGEGEGEGEEGQTQEATKWAKTMAKFLRKSTDGKILSKAVTDAQKERKKTESKTYQFEVVNADGKIKKESVAAASAGGIKEEEKPDGMKLARELLQQKAMLKRERQKDILGLRVRPSIHDYDRERTLRKVATKGTVQLFNAVRKQQKEVSEKLDEAGKLEYKREKVLKSLNKKEFLNALMNGPRAKSELVDNLVKKEEDGDVKSEIDSDEEPKSTWGALRADFLTGKKSGWDKEDGEDESRGADGLDDGMETDSD
ncbi:RRP15-like protein [Anopheles aquasalis]|uniref:RRP15-like protein n=1 Tax=Anopheles aquasalis TaxID=42839 RepID=UPI00215B395B|nr:RRP15-like protein [Anopheles aquasalis]